MTRCCGDACSGLTGIRELSLLVRLPGLLLLLLRLLLLLLLLLPLRL